jgi:hypothetical protein
MSLPPEPKHPELSIRVSSAEHSFTTIGKVTRALRNNSMHDSIEEFMKLALTAENDKEFMEAVGKFIKVANDD